MKKKNKIILFSILTLIVCISFYLDNFVSANITLIHNSFLNTFFSVITFVSSEIITFVLMNFLLVFMKEKRRWILPLWICFAVSGFVSFILKVIIHRLRPFQVGLISVIPELVEKSYSIWNFSFPSSHSMIAFCLIPILSENFPKLKKWFILFASLIAFSRIYFGFHFLSDVVIGGIIGYIIGFCIVKLEKQRKFSNKFYKKILKKSYM